MLFSEAKGQKVVSTATAETVGRVDDFVVDPKTRSVAGLLLKKTPGKEDVLPWPSVNAFGADAVMVASADVFEAPSGRLGELMDKRFHEHGKLVLSTAGVDLGTLDDIDFDPESGAVVELVIHDTRIPGAALLAAGSYAVIVDADSASEAGGRR